MEYPISLDEWVVIGCLNQKTFLTWPENTQCYGKDYCTAGPGPINILQRKFYATLIFKHSDWLLKNVNQSGCLKI